MGHIEGMYLDLPVMQNVCRTGASKTYTTDPPRPSVGRRTGRANLAVD